MTIGLLTAVLVVLLFVLFRPYEPPGGKEAAWKAVAKADVATLSGQLDAFAADTGRYPTTAEGLSALLAAPPGLASWKGPYIKRFPKDPGGRPYVYHHGGPNGGDGYRVLSVGPDGKEGTTDDIVQSSSTPATQQATPSHSSPT